MTQKKQWTECKLRNIDKKSSFRDVFYSNRELLFIMVNPINSGDYLIIAAPVGQPK